MTRSTKIKLIIAAACVVTVLLVLLTGSVYLRVRYHYTPESLADMVVHYYPYSGDFSEYQYLEQNVSEVDIGHGLTVRTAKAWEIRTNKVFYLDFIGRESAFGRYYCLLEANYDAGSLSFNLNTDTGEHRKTNFYILKLGKDAMLIQVTASSHFTDNQDSLAYEHEQNGYYYQFFYLDKLKPGYKLSSEEKTITVKDIHDWLEQARLYDLYFG